MATAGDNLIDNPLTLDTEAELRYIDHQECKIVSPGREKICPSNPFKFQVDQQNNSIDTVDSSIVTSSLKHATETGQSDSGLDSSNSSEEASVGKSVDHQESHLQQVKPDSITSPVKMVEDLFSFVNEPESLDAVNNNSEMGGSSCQATDTAESFSSECYQGREVDIHEQQQRTEVQTTIMRQSSAEINLFWYNNKTVDLDPTELESFKNSGQMHTSSLQFNVGDKYFKDKLDIEKTYKASENQQTSQKVSEKKEPREKWSPSFESASSRFLDLASEMKSDTKPKHAAVVPSDGTSVDTPLQHPWGLDGDNKVIATPDEVDTDDLPLIPHLTSDVFDMSSDDDDVDGDVPEEIDDVDVPDSMGYMECKDKDKILQANADAEAQKNAKEVKNQVLKKANNEATYGRDDESIKIESEHIVNTVVQNVQSQMMRGGGDFKFEESKSLKRKFEPDTVDGSETENIVEESFEVIATEQLKSVQPNGSRLPVSTEKFEPMEIRRKFRMKNNVEDKLFKLGATLLEVENFVDEYLDDDEYSLLLNDSWLRLRNKKFEMKVSDSFNGSSKFGAYHEIQVEKEVRQHLIKQFSSKLDEVLDKDLPLDVIVDRLGLLEFVTMETERKRYGLEECVVCVEVGGHVGALCQLEVAVDRPGQILGALDVISRTAAVLDLKPLQGH